MAFATELTIGTGNKVSLNYQSREVSVSVTYQLEREDRDVVAIVKEKTAEVAQAHYAAWKTLRDAGVAPRQTAPAKHSALNGNESACKEAAVSAKEPNLKADEPKPVDVPEASGESLQDASLTPLDGLASVSLEAPLKPATPGQCNALRLLLIQAGWNQEGITGHLLTEFGCEGLEDLSSVQAAQWLLELQRAARVNAQQQRLNGSRSGTAHSSATNG